VSRRDMLGDKEEKPRIFAGLFLHTLLSR